MNDIEILEEFIDKVDIYFNDDIGDCAITSKIAGIIENLIQENKEYEEGKKLSQKQEEMIIKVIQEAAEERIPKEMKNFISKNKIKEIIYPTPKNPISFEVQSSEMYKKLEKLVKGE